MKKIKNSFFPFVFLVFLTVGVFAESNKYHDALYIYNPLSGNFTCLAFAITPSFCWSESGSIHAITNDAFGEIYGLYYSPEVSSIIYVNCRAN